MIKQIKPLNVIIAMITLSITSCAIPLMPIRVESSQTPTSNNQSASVIAEASPESKVEANIKANTKSRSGRFVSGEHPTEGKATIFQENGVYFIELDQGFKTSTSGPDLFVILHRSPDILQISNPPDYAIAQGDYQIIAPLKSFSGKQRYAIPNNIRSDNYQSVAIWCRQYNATFGFVNLSKG